MGKNQLQVFHEADLEGTAADYLRRRAGRLRQRPLPLTIPYLQRRLRVAFFLLVVFPRQRVNLPFEVLHKFPLTRRMSDLLLEI